MAGTSSNMAYFPKGFTNGVNINGMPILQTFATSSGPANTTNAGVWWVDSVNGTDSVGGGGLGGTYMNPFKTIARALAVAKSNDIVMVKPGHTETVTAAGGITVGSSTVAGIQVIGLGIEQRRPTITLSTATTASVLISGANCLLKNLRFVHGINSLATVLDVEAVGLTVEGCEFNDGASTTGLSDIDLAAVGTTANAADRMKVVGCKFYHPTAGNMNHAIGLNLVEDFVEIVGNYIYGNFALSGLHNVTGKVLTNLSVNGNVIVNKTAAKQAMNLISACTGNSFGNYFLGGDNTVADAVYGSLTVGNGNYDRYGLADAGQPIVYSKTGIVSSTVTQAGITFATATNGALMIDNIVVKSAATGLAGGTNFQVKSNNVTGLANILVETVANLGANKTVDLNTASVTKQRTLIESTKAIQLNSTVADCTGAGTIDVHVEATRAANGAVLI